MIVDEEFLEKWDAFPMGKSYVMFGDVRYRTYRDIYRKSSKKRELCIAVSTVTKDTHLTFNLYHTPKTVRLKASENTAQATVDFIKSFTADTGEQSKPNDHKRRLFKFL
jgi:hypothetical protein